MRSVVIPTGTNEAYEMVPTSTNEAYEMMKQERKGGKKMRGKGSGSRERQEGYEYEMVSAHTTAQPLAADEVPSSQPAPPLHSQVPAAGEADYI